VMGDAIRPLHSLTSDDECNQDIATARTNGRAFWKETHAGSDIQKQNR
jgi:hypothetical protein